MGCPWFWCREGCVLEWHHGEPMPLRVCTAPWPRPFSVEEGSLAPHTGPGEMHAKATRFGLQSRPLARVRWYPQEKRCPGNDPPEALALFAIVHYARGHGVMDGLPACRQWVWTPRRPSAGAGRCEGPGGLRRCLCHPSGAVLVVCPTLPSAHITAWRVWLLEPGVPLAPCPPGLLPCLLALGLAPVSPLSPPVSIRSLPLRPTSVGCFPLAGVSLLHCSLSLPAPVHILLGLASFPAPIALARRPYFWGWWWHGVQRTRKETGDCAGLDRLDGGGEVRWVVSLVALSEVLGESPCRGALPQWRMASCWGQVRTGEGGPSCPEPSVRGSWVCSGLSRTLLGLALRPHPRSACLSSGPSSLCIVFLGTPG